METSENPKSMFSRGRLAVVALAVTAAIVVLSAIPALGQDSTAGPLRGFTLVDGSDQSVLATLSAGSSVALADSAGGSYGIRADVDANAAIGSVRLALSGAKTVSQTENIAPYALYGDSNEGQASALNGEGLPVGSYTVTATAYAESSLGGDVLGTLSVSFTVTQANRAPEFGSATYNFSIAEDASSGAAVGTVAATDADNHSLTYTIESGNGDGKFAIDGSSGAITTAGSLDHETTASYTLTVQADDGNGGTDTATVNVTVTDVDETTPGPLEGFTLVDASNQSVLATLTAGSSVAVADPAGGSYGLRADVDANAAIGSVSLALSGAKTVSARTENVAPYSLYGDGGANALSGGTLPVGSYTVTATAYAGSNLGGDELGTLSVSFTVTQANRAPAFGSATYNFSIAEDASSGAAVGTVSATDADNHSLTYTIESGNGDGKFAIDGSSGAITTAGELDFEMTPTYTLTVQADDGNGGTATATVNVSVTDVDETTPGPLEGFTLVDASNQNVLATLTAGSSVAVADPAGGSYGLRADVDANASTGSVSLALSGAKTVSARTENVAPYSLYGDGGANALDGEALPVGSYTLTATAYAESNLGGDELGTLAVSFTITQANRAPAFGSATYSFSIAEDASSGSAVGTVSATDADNHSLTYTIESGNGDGKFAIDGSSGAITTAGALDHETTPSYTLTVQADDGNGGTATAAVAVEVTEVLPDAPTDVAATATYAAVTLTWTAPEQTLSGYLVYRKEREADPPEEFAPYGYAEGDATDYTDTPLEAGTGYVYYVVSVSLDGVSEPSAEVEVDTAANALTGFTVVDASDQSEVASVTAGATVAVADPDGGSYGIRAEVDTAVTIGSVELELSGGKAVTQTDNTAPYSLYGEDEESGLSGGTLPAGSYTLTATAYAESDLGGAEVGSLEVSFTVVKEEAPVGPSTPATAVRHDRVQVQWQLPEQPETVTVEAMELLRDGLVVATVAWQRSETQYDYEDTDVMPEATYTYRVRVTAGGETLLSGEMEATTSAAPAGEAESALLLALDDLDGTASGARFLNAPVVSGQMHGAVTAQARAIIAEQGGDNGREWAQANSMEWALATTTESDSLNSGEGDFADNYTVTLEDAYDEHTLGVAVTGLTASITVKVMDDAGVVLAQGANGEAAAVTLDTLTLPYGTYTIELRLAEDGETDYSLSYELEALDPWADLRDEATLFEHYRVLADDGSSLSYYKPLSEHGEEGSVWPPNGWDVASSIRSVGYFDQNRHGVYSPSDPLLYRTFTLTKETAVVLIGGGGSEDSIFSKKVNLTLEDSEGRTVARGRRPNLTLQVLLETLEPGTYYTRVEPTDYDDRCRDFDFYLANSGTGEVCRGVTLKSGVKLKPVPEDPNKSPDIKMTYDVPSHSAPKLITPPSDAQADGRFTPIESQYTIDYVRLTWQLPDLGANVTVSSYTLQRNDEGDGGTWVDLHSSDTPFTAYVDRTVQPYAYYYYRLKLQTSGGEVRSPAYVATNPRFTTVGNVYIKEIGKDSVTIAWHPVRDTAAIDGYYIFDRQRTLTNHRLIGTVGPDVTEFTHLNVPYVPYFYTYLVVPYSDKIKGQQSLLGATAFVANHPDLRDKRDGLILTAAEEAPEEVMPIFLGTPAGDLVVYWSFYIGTSTPTGYQIRRTMWGGDHGKPRRVDIIDVQGTHNIAYVDREFRRGWISYEVRAVNDFGESGWWRPTCTPEEGRLYTNNYGSQYDWSSH